MQLRPSLIFGRVFCRWLSIGWGDILKGYRAENNVAVLLSLAALFDLMFQYENVDAAIEADLNPAKWYGSGIGVGVGTEAQLGTGCLACFPFLVSENKGS